MTHKRIGFFTRLLDDTTAQQRYRLTTEQIQHAERNGFDSAWIAQHHFHEQEGGLPSPMLFLAHVAAHTRTLRLGTAIITLAMENALRVAEDAAVLDLLSQGRLEVGLGSGGTPTSFLPFGITIDQRATVFADHLHQLLSAWRGDTLDAQARQLDAHFGDADTVLHSLLADSTLPRVTDISFQVHSIDPPHADILRSIE